MSKSIKALPDIVEQCRDLGERISQISGLPPHVVAAIMLGFDAPSDITAQVQAAREQAEQEWEQAEQAETDLRNMGILPEYCWVHGPASEGLGGWSCKACWREIQKEQAFEGEYEGE